MKIGHREMVETKKSAFDVMGHIIRRVRSVEAVDGGINVCVLHNTNYQNYPVCGYSEEEGSSQGKGVVEFCAFVAGGYIGDRPDDFATDVPVQIASSKK